MAPSPLPPDGPSRRLGVFRVGTSREGCRDLGDAGVLPNRQEAPGRAAETHGTWRYLPRAGGTPGRGEPAAAPNVCGVPPGRKNCQSPSKPSPLSPFQRAAPGRRHRAREIDQPSPAQPRRTAALTPCSPRLQPWHLRDPWAEPARPNFP
ncbi:uncharacterized protein LOC133213974 isoform X3 [Neopsephotus bourkii]|uniref:uncharacterized protein LOC133213974 isoform X3 n=1 Tax=Neopsephotus bourkii TaxID=309878 RepID=UPI002AA50723|nr:uncharacterized protein LOC133213974 isoform X3 [Neopsephotus bourkii]